MCINDTLMQQDAVIQYYVLRIYFTASRPATQPPIQQVPRGLSPGIKRPVPRHSTEAKNGGAIPTLPHTASWRSA
jgi:hypothetical protein